MSKEMRPFEELNGNPIWEEFERQAASYPDRINLTDLWRLAGRKRGRSPRSWLRSFPGYSGNIQFKGKGADGPALTDENTAFIYIQHLDPEIMLAAANVFGRAIRIDPAGCLMSAANHSEGTASIAGMFISAANAVDGSRTEGNARIMEQVIERTQHLDTYSQETQVAKAQRALLGASQIKSGRLIDGELIEDV